MKDLINKLKNMTEKRKDFLLGLTTGTSAAFFIALIILSGSYYSNVMKISENKKAEKEVVEDSYKQKEVSKNSIVNSDIKIVEGDYIRGRKDAPITIVEFSDFQCPFCSRFHETLSQVMAEYPNDVNWVFRHFPLDKIHPYARQASEATECAGEQGKFWEYNDGLFANQKSINPQYLNILANNIGLDAGQFQACLDEGKYSDKVENDFQIGKKNGITGTPGWFINGKLEKGALPYEQLKAMIDNMLK